jgi:hypothetical protein
VEVLGLQGVVHEDDDPPVEVGRGCRQPAVEGETDLGDLAVAELDPLGREAGGQVRRRRLGLEPAKRAILADGDQELADAAGAADDPVDGKRVEDLVGDDGPGLAIGRPHVHEAAIEPVRGQARPEQLEPRRLDLDRPVADRPEQWRGEVPETAQHPKGEGSGARPGLGHGEWHRPPDRVPCLLEQAADGSAEDRVRLRGGEEVGAGLARPGRVPPVVAVPRLVQGALHEAGEGDRTVAPDLVADGRRENLVHACRRGIRQRLAPEPRHGAG